MEADIEKRCAFRDKMRVSPAGSKRGCHHEITLDIFVSGAGVSARSKTAMAAPRISSYGYDLVPSVLCTVHR
jgi:hypothetical protein